MNNNKFYDCLNKIIKGYKDIGIELSYKIDSPVNQEDLVNYLKINNLTIPNSLFEFFVEISGSINVSGELSEDISNAIDKRSICFVRFYLSYNEIAEAEKERVLWVKNCYSDINDKYDRIWHNKLGLLRIGNGDIIAIDKDESIVYLSHDGGDGHGVILGKNIEDFFDNIVLFRLIDFEDLCVYPELINNTNYIDAKSNKFDIIRKLIDIS